MRHFVPSLTKRSVFRSRRVCLYVTTSKDLPMRSSTRLYPWCFPRPRQIPCISKISPRRKARCSRWNICPGSSTNVRTPRACAHSFFCSAPARRYGARSCMRRKRTQNSSRRSSRTSSTPSKADSLRSTSRVRSSRKLRRPSLCARLTVLRRRTCSRFRRSTANRVSR